MPHDVIDLGEIACLVRMFEICKTVESIFPPGCIITLVTDGVIYHELFGATFQEAINFRTSLEKLISQMNISDRVRIIDMINLVNRFGSEFDLLKDKIAEELKSPELAHKMTNLQKGVAPNLNLTETPLEILFHLFNSNPDNIPENLQNDFSFWREDIATRSRKTAIGYASTLLAIKKLQIIEKIFPRAIRATVHPKPGQLGLFLVNNGSALGSYHGIPLLKKSNGKNINLKNLKIRYELDVRSRQNVRPVFLKGQNFPLFWEEHNSS